MFNYLSTERYLIPLGLYRLTGALDNEHAYVFTNPSPKVTLTHRDKVFYNKNNGNLVNLIDSLY